MPEADRTERAGARTLLDDRGPDPFGVGALVAGRYRLEEALGAGGMGVVHRARDLERGELVAVKLIRAGLDGAKVRERFERETAALAAVSHPGVVRYLDHGSEREIAYLVMELIEGEDLAQRLARGPLTLDEILALAQRLAAALAAAHAAGIVHRDLKPSNILLPSGRFEQAKLLDFGVARLQGQTALTGTGHVLGTPGYMSPEQARGLVDVDERTDVYSLGCVLFECLTGEPPFPGAHAMAVLAKILLEDTPRVTGRARAPLALDELVHAMMARDRASRPATATDLLARLETLDLTESTAEAEPSVAPSPSLSHSEQRVLTVLFAGRPGLLVDTVHGVSTELGGDAIELIDGSVLISFPGVETPTDQAARAVRCALLLHARQPHSPIVLASGHGILGRHSLIGEVIDRGAELMQLVRDGELSSRPEYRAELSSRPGDRADIRLDEPTAALVEPICLLDYDDDGARLQGMRGSDEPLRTLLGRPTPFVGRARELAALEAVIDEALTEPCASAAIVLGEPGLGKSRLRYELLRRVAVRWPEADVMIGRADPIGADAAFGLLARALRGAAGIRSGEPAEQQRALLREYLFAKLDLSTATRERLAAFLGELLGIPSEAGSTVLDSMRADPQLLREAIAEAWEQWLDHRCRRGGVIVVLEDLHWGDVGTIDLVGRSLTHDEDRALVVLALARPELDDRHPRLWAGCDPHRIELESLPRRAARKLVTRMLTDADPHTIETLVERAGGNAFYLEELIRATAGNAADSLPDTIVGMVQSRLAQLRPELRRLLRAGAVFGEICWTGGVARLVSEAKAEVAKLLDELATEEFLTRREQSTVPGSSEYTFRHALVRDAAYATLTAEDRRVAHALAAEWLASTGAAEPAVLARHFMLGARLLEAIGWFEKAALAALDAEDHVQARKLAEDGIACAAEGEALGRLQGLLARVAEEAGEHVDAIALAEAALERLPEHTQPWYATIFVLLESLGRASRFEPIEPWLERLLAVAPASEALDACVRASAVGASHLSKAGRLAAARAYAERTRMLMAAGSPGPLARLQWLFLEFDLADMAGDVGRMLALLPDRDALVELIDSPMLRAHFESGVGHIYAQVGANEQAEAGFEFDREYAARRGLRHRHHASVGMLAFLAHRRGDLVRATELLALARAVETSDRRFIGVLAGLAATLALARGDLEQALAEARSAEAMLSVARPLHPYGLAVLTNVLRARGQIEQAIAYAEQAIAIVDELGGVSEIEVDVQVAYIEALLTAGLRDRAIGELRRFEARFNQRLAGIDDPELRACFCTRVPANARLLELCEALLRT